MVDIATMKPAGKTKTVKPTAKGAAGSALGILLVRMAEAKADAEVKANESMKATLGKIEKLTREDHLAFRIELDAKVSIYKLTAETDGQTLNALRSSDPKVNSVVVSVSLWRKMSEACEAGFKPDYVQPWAYISQKATEVLQAKASTHIGTEAHPATASPITKKKGRTGKSGFEKAMDILKTLPLQDVEKIRQWCDSRLVKNSH